MNALEVYVVAQVILLVIVWIVSILCSRYRKYLINKYNSMGTIVVGKLKDNYSDDEKRMVKYLKLTNKF